MSTCRPRGSCPVSAATAGSPIPVTWPAACIPAHLIKLGETRPVFDSAQSKLLSFRGWPTHFAGNHVAAALD